MTGNHVSIARVSLRLARLKEAPRLMASRKEVTFGTPPGVPAFVFRPRRSAQVTCAGQQMRCGNPPQRPLSVDRPAKANVEPCRRRGRPPVKLCDVESGGVKQPSCGCTRSVTRRSSIGPPAIASLTNADLGRPRGASHLVVTPRRSAWDGEFASNW